MSFNKQVYEAMSNVPGSTTAELTEILGLETSPENLKKVSNALSWYKRIGQADRNNLHRWSIVDGQTSSAQPTANSFSTSQAINTPKLSIANQVLMALHDNQVMSLKELIQYLKDEDRSVNEGTVTATLVSHRKNKLVEHRGYNRNQLTDLGRCQVSLILEGGNPVVNNSKLKLMLAKKQHSQETVEVPTAEGERYYQVGEPGSAINPLVIEEPASEPDKVSEPIDWQREFIKLAHAIAGGKNE